MGWNPYHEAWQRALGADRRDLLGIEPYPDSVFQARLRLVDEFSWAIPGRMAIAAIAGFARDIVEVGAGHGYWARLLHDAGVSIRAYDNGSWKYAATWYPVGQADGLPEAERGAECLMLVWPHPGAYYHVDALADFQGHKFVYVGEEPGGVTGCPFSKHADYPEYGVGTRARDNADRWWRCVRRIPIPQWPAVNDAVWLFTR